MTRTEVWHERLGALQRSQDGTCWEATVPVGEAEIVFEIGGKKAPDVELLAHAIDILDDFPAFRDAFARFLDAEAERLPAFAEEIRELEIETIMLAWPERPEDGMIFFGGPDTHRIWRCDYIDRQPRDLGFDD